MDERLGRKISGILRGSGISWHFTRAQGTGVGM